MLGDLADGANGEPGCIGFRVLSGDDPGEFVLLASWTSEGTLRTHYTTDHYRRYREQMGPLLARPSDVVVHYLRATVHALDPNLPDQGSWDEDANGRHLSESGVCCRVVVAGRP